MRLKFPKGFLWGAATSAYQVEGGVTGADWSRFYAAGAACDHYHLYEKDFDILEELNLNAYRFSLEWSRIEPEEGKFSGKEIDHYRRMLSSLKKRGIRTMATLHHFTTPLWLAEKGTWEYSRAPSCFARFSQKVFSELGDLVDFWVTFNEPVSVYGALGYLAGKWPPQKKNLLSFLKVLRNEVKAHRLVYEALNEKAKVGVVKNNQFFEPAAACPLDHASVFLARYFSNRLFLDFVEDHLDFIGLNYYFHNKVRFPWRVRNENEVVSDLGWEVYPEGIYHVLKGLEKYDLPIYITENGVADSKDRLRKDFIKDHLLFVHRALEEGVDVRGYFYWSLLDNLEWDKGYEPRFGLVEVDFESQKRRVRESARFYAQVAEENGFKL